MTDRHLTDEELAERARDDLWDRHYWAAWRRGFGTACGLFLIVISLLIFALTHVRF